MTRRQLLKGLLGAAALPLLPKVAAEEPIKPVEPFEFLDSSPASEPRRCLGITNKSTEHDIYIGGKCVNPSNCEIRIRPQQTCFVRHEPFPEYMVSDGVDVPVWITESFGKPAKQGLAGTKTVRIPPTV